MGACAPSSTWHAEHSASSASSSTEQTWASTRTRSGSALEHCKPLFGSLTSASTEVKNCGFQGGSCRTSGYLAETGDADGSFDEQRLRLSYSAVAMQLRRPRGLAVKAAVKDFMMGRIVTTVFRVG